MQSGQSNSHSLITKILAASSKKPPIRYQPITFKVVENSTPNIACIYFWQSHNYERAYNTNLNYVYILDEENSRLGYAKYEVMPQHIYIDLMKNVSSNLYVGTALHEWVVRKSVELGRGGNVHLNSSSTASCFHFSYGFRFKDIFLDERDNQRVLAELKKAKEAGKRALGEWLPSGYAALPWDTVLAKRREYKLVDPTQEDFLSRKQQKLHEEKEAKEEWLTLESELTNKISPAQETAGQLLLADSKEIEECAVQEEGIRRQIKECETQKEKIQQAVLSAQAELEQVAQKKKALEVELSACASSKERLYKKQEEHKTEHGLRKDAELALRNKIRVVQGKHMEAQSVAEFFVNIDPKMFAALPKKAAGLGPEVGLKPLSGQGGGSPSWSPQLHKGKQENPESSVRIALPTDQQQSSPSLTP